MTDALFLLDVQNVSDDHRFFPFGDAIKEIVLCFSRDCTESTYAVHEDMERKINIEKNNKNNKNNDNDNDDKNNDNTENNLNFTEISLPTVRSVKPFLGFSTYFAPLCFLFENRSTLYSTVNKMWDTVWCKLNVLSGDEGTLLHVCTTFENLLISVHPLLFLHLLKLNVQPLRIAFPWIQLAFVSFFEIDQLLILWDRVLGFTDLTLFSLLAVSIFLSRAEPLLQCKSKENAILILNEGSRLKVIPLLQMILFSEK